MPIRWVTGDLFANAYKVQAFAHGCNCQGSMGAGIAKGFRERYPRMYEEYRTLCKAKPRRFNLGDAWLWKDARRPWVFNLGTQEKYWRGRASYEAIEDALKRMKEQADAEGIASIGMPRIGVGYGGLSWKKVRPIIEGVFSTWSGTLVVYEEYEPGQPRAKASEPVATVDQPFSVEAARLQTPEDWLRGAKGARAALKELGLDKMPFIINAERSKSFKCYAAPELVEQRRVVEVSYNVGSYGMGGYGFLGLRLAARKPQPTEWLVCTLFAADAWFTANGRWLAADPEQYEEQRPLHGYGYRLDEHGRWSTTGETWDEFQPLVLRQKLTAFRCATKSCQLVIGEISLEIAEDPRQRPIFIGTLQPRRLRADENLRQAWILARDATLSF